MTSSRMVVAVTVAVVVAIAGAAVATLRDRAGRSAGREAAVGLTEDLRSENPSARVQEHLAAFDEIARANHGTRASGTPGYEVSVDYVIRQLETAGYDVTTQRFPFTEYDEQSPPRLVVDDEQIDDESFKPMLFSPSGRERGPVMKVGGTDRSFAGCTPSDFEGFPDGHIALVTAANCRFRDQAANAEAAGAGALLVATRKRDAGVGVLRGTVGAEPGIDIPVIGITHELGTELSDGRFVRMRVDAREKRTFSYNVIAQTPHGRDDTVVMVGAHLDSVVDGPGINDNASGSAALLATSEALVNKDLRNAVRFAWWGAEEYGLMGSMHYVEALDEAERASIAAYLNFDMVGSPNFVRYVYKGAGEPEGSVAIEGLFRAWFDERDLEIKTIPLEGRSDHAAFSQAGIPVGGLFTGANMVKTRDEVDDFGGERGIAEDPCYHLACDDLENVDFDVLEEMMGAITHAVGTMASIPGAIP